MARKHVTDAHIVSACWRLRHEPKVVIEWVDEHGIPGRSFRTVFDILVAETGECFKVVEAALWRAYKRKLINFGVSLNFPFLTPRGEELHQLNERTPIEKVHQLVFGHDQA